ncbi:MAG TPA: hypothetical protein VIH72_13725 [Candidatus Acidoferrales bacterium]
MKRWTLLEIRARTPRIALASFLFCFLYILIAGPCWADDASAKAARELAQKIAAQIDHKKKVIVELVDLTGEMRAAELDDAKKAIENELRAGGLRLVADTSFDLKVRITLSADNIERLWIADFDNDGARATLIEPFERSSFDAKPWASRTHVDRELVFSGNASFLDFACTNLPTAKDCGNVLVLYPNAVVLMDSAQNFPRAAISQENGWPRDLRGRIKISGSDFEARVENVECLGNAGHVQSAKCGAQTGAWDFAGPQSEAALGEVVSFGNFFVRAGIAPTNGAKVKTDPFYSLNGMEINGEPGWISIGVDGSARLFTEKSGQILGTSTGWGSELASVKTDCGTGWQILVTSARDHTETDSITVYEWSGHEFRALSDPLEMDGPVIAMWSGQDGGRTRAVVRNLKTGNYEAYLLKVGCSQ